MSVRMETGKGKIEESYVGAVLATRERNYYDDSDFYAVVWDEIEQRVKAVEYATTRFATHKNSADVDATPEVVAKAHTWAYSRALEAAKAEDEADAKAVKVGRVVRVVAGRKVPVGTEGPVVWTGEKVYGPRTELRVGIRTADGVVYTAARNVEVADPDMYRADGETLANRAKRVAEGASRGAAWGAFFARPGMVVV